MTFHWLCFSALVIFFTLTHQAKAEMQGQVFPSLPSDGFVAETPTNTDKQNAINPLDQPIVQKSEVVPEEKEATNEQPHATQESSAEKKAENITEESKTTEQEVNTEDTMKIETTGFINAYKDYLDGKKRKLAFTLPKGILGTVLDVKKLASGNYALKIKYTPDPSALEKRKGIVKEPEEVWIYHKPKQPWIKLYAAEKNNFKEDKKFLWEDSKSNGYQRPASQHKGSKPPLVPITAIDRTPIKDNSNTAAVKKIESLPLELSPSQKTQQIGKAAIEKINKYEEIKKGLNGPLYSNVCDLVEKGKLKLTTAVRSLQKKINNKIVDVMESDRGEPIVRWNECSDLGGITANYYDPKKEAKGINNCNTAMIISKDFSEFLSNHLAQCSEVAAKSIGLSNAIKGIRIAHAGITGDASHSTKSLHYVRRAMDIKKLTLTLDNGEVHDMIVKDAGGGAKKNSPTKKELLSLDFYHQFRLCWAQQLQQQNKCSAGKGYRGSISWEDSDHPEHMHLSLPFCPNINDYFYN